MRSPYLDSDRVYPPLGILYLKSYLNRHGIEVGLEDEFDFSHPEKYDKYEAFGASVMTPQRQASLDFLSYCKDRWKDRPVIIGGPHARHYLLDVEKEAWDYIVPNDGQRALVKILQGNGNRIENDFIRKQEWADIDRPDRTSKEAISLLSRYSYSLNGVKSTTLLTALGCPELCSFCEDSRTAVRWSSIESINAQLDDIVNLGYKGVYIFDDLFAISLKMIIPICQEIKKRGIIYRCNGQARYFNEDFAKLLASTGCKEIAFGAESGSQEMLNVVQKRTTVEQNYKFVRLCKEYGITCKAFLMIGLPGETKDTIYQTEEFIKNAELDDFQLSIYYPYKGTRLRDAIDKGENTVDLQFEGEGLGAYGQIGGSTEAVVRTSSLSAEELLQERDRIVKMYRPQSHINKWERQINNDHFFDTQLNSKVEYGN